MVSGFSRTWDEHMLKGTRDGILRKVQPVSIHGQVTWDVFFTDVEDPEGQIHVARIGPEAVMGTNPCHFNADHPRCRQLETSTFPVETVSWQEAVEFCRKLSELPEEQKAGRLYRLPTEAEWEYTC